MKSYKNCAQHTLLEQQESACAFNGNQANNAKVVRAKRSQSANKKQQQQQQQHSSAKANNNNKLDTKQTSIPNSNDNQVTNLNSNNNCVNNINNHQTNASFSATNRQRNISATAAADSHFPLHQQIPCSNSNNKLLGHQRKQNHCEIEKRRRDKMNSFIMELASVIPKFSNSRCKFDKLTVLRMAVQHVKSIKSSPCSFSSFHLRPPFLSSGNLLKNLILQMASLEAQDNFFLVVSCDKGKVLFASKSSKDIILYDQDELVGQCLFDLLHKDDVSKVKEQISHFSLSPREMLVDSKTLQPVRGNLQSMYALQSQSNYTLQPGARRSFFCRVKSGKSSQHQQSVNAINQQQQHQHRNNNSQQQTNVADTSKAASEAQTTANACLSQPQTLTTANSQTQHQQQQLAPATMQATDSQANDIATNSKSSNDELNCQRDELELCQKQLPADDDNLAGDGTTCLCSKKCKQTQTSILLNQQTATRVECANNNNNGKISISDNCLVNSNQQQHQLSATSANLQQQQQLASAAVVDGNKLNAEISELQPQMAATVDNNSTIAVSSRNKKQHVTASSGQKQREQQQTNADSQQQSPLNATSKHASKAAGKPIGVERHRSQAKRTFQPSRATQQQQQSTTIGGGGGHQRATAMRRHHWRYVLLHCTGYLKSLTLRGDELDSNLDELSSDEYYSDDNLSDERVQPHCRTINCLVAVCRRSSIDLNPDRPLTFTCRYSMEGKFVFVDQRTTLALGYTPQQLLGTSHYAYCHEASVNTFKECHRKSIQNSEAISSDIYQFKRANGQLLWLQTSLKSFRNPWTKLIDYIVASHTTAEGSEPNYNDNSCVLPTKFDREIGGRNGSESSSPASSSLLSLPSTDSGKKSTLSDSASSNGSSSSIESYISGASNVQAILQQIDSVKTGSLKYTLDAAHIKRSSIAQESKSSKKNDDSGNYSETQSCSSTSSVSQNSSDFLTNYNNNNNNNSNNNNNNSDSINNTQQQTITQQTTVTTTTTTKNNQALVDVQDVVQDESVVNLQQQQQQHATAVAVAASAVVVNRESIDELGLIDEANVDDDEVQIRNTTNDKSIVEIAIPVMNTASNNIAAYEQSASIYYSQNNEVASEEDAQRNYVAPLADNQQAGQAQHLTMRVTNAGNPQQQQQQQLVMLPMTWTSSDGVTDETGSTVDYQQLAGDSRAQNFIAIDPSVNSNLTHSTNVMPLISAYCSGCANHRCSANLSNTERRQQQITLGHQVNACNVRPTTTDYPLNQTRDHQQQQQQQQHRNHHLQRMFVQSNQLLQQQQQRDQCQQQQQQQRRVDQSAQQVNMQWTSSATDEQMTQAYQLQVASDYCNASNVSQSLLNEQQQQTQRQIISSCRQCANHKCSPASNVGLHSAPSNTSQHQQQQQHQQQHHHHNHQQHHHMLQQQQYNSYPSSDLNGINLTSLAVDGDLDEDQLLEYLAGYDPTEILHIQGGNSFANYNL